MVEVVLNLSSNEIANAEEPVVEISATDALAMLSVRPPPTKPDAQKEAEKKTLRELSALCRQGNGSVPAKTFAAFLRSRLHNEEAAVEVEDLVKRLTSERAAATNIDAGGIDDGPTFSSDAGMHGNSSLVLLKSGVILSNFSSSVRFNQASAVAYVSRKLNLMTEDSQEADKAQLAADISALENLLANMEAEVVELNAMFQSPLAAAVAPAAAVNTALAKLSAEQTDDNIAFHGYGHEGVEKEITLFSVQQRLDHLFILRGKARALCGEDSDDEEPGVANANYCQRNLVSAPTGTSLMRGHGYGTDQEKDLTPKEKKERYDKRQTLLKHISTELDSLADSVAVEIDRRICLIANSSSLQEQRDVAVAGIPGQPSRAVLTTMDVDLAPALAVSKRLRTTACIKDLLEMKRSIRSSRQSMHIVSSKRSIVNQEESAGEQEIDNVPADRNRDTSALHAFHGHRVQEKKQWDDPRSSVEGLDLDERVFQDILSGKSSDEEQQPLEKELATETNPLSSVESGPTPDSADLSKLHVDNLVPWVLPHSVMDQLSSAIVASLPTISATIFSAQMGDLFSASDYRPPLDEEALRTDPMQGPLVDSLIRASQEWPPRPVRVHTNYSGLFPDHSHKRNSNGDTLIEDEERKRLHHIKTAAERITRALVATLSTLVRQDRRDNSVSAMLGVRRGLVWRAHNVQFPGKSPPGDKEKENEDTFVSYAPASLLRACVAASIGEMISEVCANARSEKAPDRVAATAQYMKQVDRYFRTQLRDQESASSSSPRSPRPHPRSTDDSSSSSKANTTPRLDRHKQNLQKKHEAELLRAKGDAAKIATPGRNHSQGSASDAAIRAKKRERRLEYRSWLTERQIMLLLSWLPQSFQEDAMLALQRYPVHVLVCASWVVAGQARPCLARELTMWLVQELELGSHCVETCSCCNRIICSHEQGARLLRL